MHFDLQLSLVLHLTKVHELLMANDLILIMCERIEHVGLVISKCRVNYFKLSENAREFDRDSDTELNLCLVFL